MINDDLDPSSSDDLIIKQIQVHKIDSDSDNELDNEFEKPSKKSDNESGNQSGNE